MILHQNEWSYTPEEIKCEVEPYFNYFKNLSEGNKEKIQELIDSKIQLIEERVKNMMFWKEAKAIPYTPPPPKEKEKKKEPRGLGLVEAGLIDKAEVEKEVARVMQTTYVSDSNKPEMEASSNSWLRPSSATDTSVAATETDIEANES